MAAEREAAGLRSIAEKLQGHWEAVHGSEQRTRGEGLGCRRAEAPPSRQY